MINKVTADLKIKTLLYAFKCFSVCVAQRVSHCTLVL
jgi:hypothetical protein